MSAGDLTHFLLPSSRLATDVIFTVGEERIPAHKVTIASLIYRVSLEEFLSGYPC